MINQLDSPIEANILSFKVLEVVGARAFILWGDDRPQAMCGVMRGQDHVGDSGSDAMVFD